jgi:acetylglutamate kinase
VHKLLLRVGPNCVTESGAQRGITRLERREVAFRVELSDQRVKRRSFTDRTCHLARRKAEALEDPKIVPLEKFLDRVERARVGPHFTQRRLQDALELAGRMVEIDRRKHHVAGQYEGLERDDAAAVDSEYESTPGFERAQRAHQLIGVVAAAHDAAEVAVAQQVVHAIRVEIGAADEFAEHRKWGFGIARNEAENRRMLDADPIECGPNLGQRENCARASLVRYAKDRFTGVAERTVPDVVKQQARAEQPSLRREFGRVTKTRRIVTTQRVEDPVARRQRAERVTETRVLRCGKGQISKPELPQAPQPLKRAGVEEFDFAVVQLDEVVDRVENPLHSGQPFAAAGVAPARTESARVLIVLKYGGNAMAVAGQDPLLDDVAARVAAGDQVVLVHGGGPQIDAELAERRIPTVRVDGLRVTDEATLAATERILCGTVNKALVRALLRRDVRAAGISGQDDALLAARPATSRGGAALGFVGEIVEVRSVLLTVLLDAGMVPVVAPIALAEDGTTALNVNADTAAGAIAGALRADAYVVVTNVDRVRRAADDPTSGFARLTASEVRAYLDDGTFDGGMRPKMESALDALGRGARTVLVTGQGPGALAGALAGNGTTIVDG